MARVVDTLWFTNMKGVIGIVILAEDVTNDRKAYISVVDGHDQNVDTQTVISYGNPLSVDTIERLLYGLGERRLRPWQR